MTSKAALIRAAQPPPPGFLFFQAARNDELFVVASAGRFRRPNERSGQLRIATSWRPTQPNRGLDEAAPNRKTMKGSKASKLVRRRRHNNSNNNSNSYTRNAKYRSNDPTRSDARASSTAERRPSASQCYACLSVCVCVGRRRRSSARRRSIQRIAASRQKYFGVRRSPPVAPGATAAARDVKTDSVRFFFFWVKLSSLLRRGGGGGGSRVGVAPLPHAMIPGTATPRLAVPIRSSPVQKQS